MFNRGSKHSSVGGGDYWDRPTGASQGGRRSLLHWLIGGCWRFTPRALWHLLPFETPPALRSLLAAFWHDQLWTLHARDLCRSRSDLAVAPAFGVPHVYFCTQLRVIAKLPHQVGDVLDICGDRRLAEHNRASPQLV